MALRSWKARDFISLSKTRQTDHYHILRTKKPYTDLGADSFDHQDRGRIERHHIHRLEQLGSTVTLTPKEAA